MFSRSLQAAEEYYRASLGLLIVLQGLDASGSAGAVLRRQVTAALVVP
jgi:polyphosphate kinase 2 (PPK2 family)